MKNFAAHPIPFVEHLGFTLHQMGQGTAEVHYTAQPEHFNGFGMNHGGTSLTLMDVTMAVAAFSLNTGDAVGCLTVELKTSFMHPARGPVVARGAVLHRTRSLAFCEARLVDADGTLCCHATGTFKYQRPMHTGERAAHSALAADAKLAGAAQPAD